MKTFPKNICAHPDGLLVRIKRGKILYQAFVPKSHATPLDRAIELRDRFLKIAGEVKRPKSTKPHKWARSNTGVPGVSQTVSFRGTRALQCFNVSWSVCGKQKMKRFGFGSRTGREFALRNAIAFRRQMTEVRHV